MTIHIKPESKTDREKLFQDFIHNQFNRTKYNVAVVMANGDILCHDCILNYRHRVAESIEQNYADGYNIVEIQLDPFFMVNCAGCQGRIA